MAILNSTSPGQLGKYVIPTVQKLNTSMKKGTPLSRGSARSYRIKNNQNNINAISEFSETQSKNENTFLDLVQIETLFWTICSKQFGYVQNSFGLIEGQCRSKFRVIQ